MPISCYRSPEAIYQCLSAVIFEEMIIGFSIFQLSNADEVGDLVRAVA